MYDIEKKICKEEASEVNLKEENLYDIEKQKKICKEEASEVNLKEEHLYDIEKKICEASEVIKRLPDLPLIMDRANDVMSLMAEGKFNPNTLAYRNLREEELKLELLRNKILGGILVLVIFTLLVFKL